MTRKTLEPVFNIHYTYVDMTGARVTYIKSVRAPDEMSVRIWVQKMTAKDCRTFISLDAYESTQLHHHQGIPHIYDLEDVDREIKQKIPAPIYPSIGSKPSPPVVVEAPLNELPWADKYHLWPGKGLGTTKTSNRESFYDAAEGAYE